MKVILHTVLWSVSLIAAQVHAGADTGFYVGGSVGASLVDEQTESLEFDETDAGFKIFGGYNFGVVPFVDVAAEIAYFRTEIDGDTNVTINGQRIDSLDTEIEIDAFSAQALVGVKTGPVGLFGKLGVVQWDSESDINITGDLNVSDDEDGTDITYGLGARFQLFSFAVRAEWERFEADDTDVDFFSVGAVYTF